MLTIGSRLGPYEIVSAIGAGGMGEVYRAHDSRLGRDVAIKVLPAAFSSDPERLQRFEQEARSAAASNHPNILAVHDIGQHDGAPYIVSELLEGETLRERLNAGAIPVRKTIEYGIQIARGLAAAHEKGIVHRDLKPENVFVTADGRVKILDFGLAKLTQAEPALAGLSALPTTPRNTSPGVVLGTIGYMSPEQVRGLPADHRSDIFAFGTVLYEMLSGQRAFHGDTTADTMSAILKEDLAGLPSTERHIPPALARIVERCVEKNPGARFQSTRDLAFAIEGLSTRTDSTIATQSPAIAGGLGHRSVWVTAAIVSTLWLMATGASVYMRQPANIPEVRFEIPTPPVAPLNLAISPNGAVVAFVARAPGTTENLVWIRSLDSTTARPLDGTQGAPQEPFWSPDSRQLGFYAEGKLKKVDVNGGPAQILCDAPGFAGATWNRQDVIVFSSGSTLKRVRADGGDPVTIMELDKSRQETGHRWPFFLPDGTHFLFLASSLEPGHRAIYVGSLDSSERTRVMGAESKAVYAAPGHLFFHRAGALMAQAFDSNQLETTADPIRVADNVAFNTLGRGAFAAADNGTVVYRASGAAQTTQLTWFDRSGRQLALATPPGQYADLELSSDDRYVAFEQAAPGGDIWVVDLESGITSRVTYDPARDADPVWSPDGQTIAFRSDRDGGNLYQRAFAAVGEDVPLMRSDAPKDPSDWSRDGKYLTYETAGDVWALPLSGDGKPLRVTATPFTEVNSRISPDGRWVAYQSNESGGVDIYVQAFMRPGAKQQVSTNGGTQARWSRDGTELFYLGRPGRSATPGAPTSTLMGVSINSSGVRPFASPPIALFETRINSGEGNYAMSTDGRFLLNMPTELGSTVPITVILNWAEPHE